jgi:hypothetical protein
LHVIICAVATFRIWSEGDGRFPILNVAPALEGDEKAYGRGPFITDRALIEELVAVCKTRCLMSGCAAPAGKVVDTWRIRTQLPARDASIVTAALTRFLQDADDQPLRTFIAHPPHLRSPPLPGESWDVVT